jgi:hypothetical protein
VRTGNSMVPMSVMRRRAVRVWVIFEWLVVSG